MKINTASFIVILLSILGIACQSKTTEEQSQSVDAQPLSQPTTTETIPEKIVFDSAIYNYTDGILTLDWDLLGNIDFNEQYNDDVEAFVPYPVFHPTVKALDGKTVLIEGYVIPIEETLNENILVLSAFPYSNCFFCGGAGPESVMDILLKDQGRRFKTDETLTFKGKLKLNDTDLYYLNYMLEDATIFK